MDNLETNTLIAQSSGISAIIEVTKEATFNPIITIDTKQLGDKTLPAQIPLHFDPESHLLCSITSQLDDYRNTPKHRTGVSVTNNLASFINLVNYHKVDETVIFALADMPSPNLLAVIDYHSKTHQPNNLKHKILYNFPLTTEFKTWLQFNNKSLSQEEFATFLEAQITELAAPTADEITKYCALFYKKHIAEPVELLELAKSIEININSNVKNGQNTATGEKTIIYTEQHEGANTKTGETVTVPSLFMVSVAPFVDGALVRIPARLAYKVTRGEVKWTYTLFRPDDYLKEQVLKDLDKAQVETALEAFQAQPEI